MVSGIGPWGCLPISKILLFKIYSCAAVEKRQGGRNALPAMQNGKIQGEEVSKGSMADKPSTTPFPALWLI